MAGVGDDIDAKGREGGRQNTPMFPGYCASGRTSDLRRRMREAEEKEEEGSGNPITSFDLCITFLHPLRPQNDLTLAQNLRKDPEDVGNTSKVV